MVRQLAKYQLPVKSTLLYVDKTMERGILLNTLTIAGLKCLFNHFKYLFKTKRKLAVYEKYANENCKCIF